jgi:hypothetical protein
MNATDGIDYNIALNPARANVVYLIKSLSFRCLKMESISNLLLTQSYKEARSLSLFLFSLISLDLSRIFLLLEFSINITGLTFNRVYNRSRLDYT